MIISGNIIVKDDSELERLKKSVASFIDYVDEVCITANGEKAEKIEEYCHSNKKLKYSYLKWNRDFSEQRNFNFSQSRKDTDFHWWQDADDLLVGGEFLRPLAEIAKKNGKDVVFLSYWYGCEFEGEPSLETFKDVTVEHLRERLIRPGVITWKGRLHETPVPVSGQKDNYTKVAYHEKDSPVAVMHTASMVDSYERMHRNRDILELQLLEEGKNRDPRTLLYLMKIYTEIGTKENGLLNKCIEMGHEYLLKSGWDEERGTACELIAVCSGKLGLIHDTITFLHQAIQEYPYQPVHYIRLSMAYFDVGRYKEAKHWLKIAGDMGLDDQTAGIKNLKEIKVLFAQMLLRVRYQVDKDLPGAVKAAEMLYQEQPIKENHENLLFMMDLLDLYNASEHAKGLVDYLTAIGNPNVINAIDLLPEAISEQPWAIAKRRENMKPRLWGKNEICYFANFGGKHFEKWDGNSLKTGQGGSETAVIRLSEEWVKRGYRVFVYGDPAKPCEINGVTYLPWYYFNKADKFNIFIQWRNAVLAPVVKARKFFVDLHDIVNQVDYSRETMSAVDGIFFKSQYHRDLVPQLPDSKAFIVGNGI